MESDEYVETSDPEELEAAWFAAQSSSRQNSLAPDVAVDIFTPRKRRKLMHETDLELPQQKSSPAKTTASRISPSQDTAALLLKQVDGILSQPLPEVEDQSEDELDVISQRLRSNTPKIRKRTPPPDKDSETLIDTITEESNGEIPLCTPPPSPGVNLQSPSQHVNAHASPDSSPRTSEHRFSSLPPSSSSHPPTPIHRSQRARTHSPTPSPLKAQHPNVKSANSEPSHDVPTSDTNNDHEVAANLARGRYSFRSRKPQQERPYAYDLKLYKGQLQNIPEAIVAAPKNHDRSDRQRHDKDSHAQETQDDDFVVPDNGSDGERILRQRRQSSDELLERPAVHIPEIMQMSDDDDLPQLAWTLDDASYAKEHDMDHSKPAKRRKKMFPLRKHHSLHLAEKGGSDGSPEPQGERITQLLRREIHKRRSQVELSPVVSSMHQETASRAVSQATSSTMKFDLATNGDDDVYDPPGDSSPSRTSTLSLRLPVEKELSSDEETKLPSSPESQTGSEIESLEARKQRKRMKAWSKMMPKFMINRMMGETARTRPRPKSPLTVSDDKSGSDDFADLAPGQSKRVIRGVGHGAPIEIRGDTESSDSSVLSEDDPSASDDSMSEDEGIDPGQNEEAVEAGWFDHDSSRRHVAPPSNRNEDLIDRMLTRTRTRKARPTRRFPGHSVRPPRNPALDIIIAAPTRQKAGIQTRLPFRPEQPANEKSSVSRSLDLKMSGISPESRAFIPLNASKKPSKKERKQKLLSRQTFVVPSDGKLIQSGRKKRTRIDVHDDALHDALALIHKVDMKAHAQDTRRHNDSPSNCAISSRRNPHVSLRQTRLTEFEEEDPSISKFDYMESESPRHNGFLQSRNYLVRHRSKLKADLGIGTLPIGLAFGPNTYIGKQLLHDFITSLSNATTSTEPIFSNKLGVIFSPGISASEYVQNLDMVTKVLCERLEAADDGSDKIILDFKDYELLMYASCRCMDAIIARYPDDQQKLHAAASDCTSRITEVSQARLDSIRWDPKHSSFEPLSALWFAIELSSRSLVAAARMNLENDVTQWKERVVLLIRILSSFEFERILERISSPSAENLLDDTSDEVTAASLWVCLIHLLPKLSEVANPTGTNCLSSLLLESFQEQRDQCHSGVENSEHIWRTVFSLCALSQFSINGNSAVKAAMPPCWDVILTALNTIRLTHEPSVDQTRAQNILRHRDKYVHFIVSRCYLLCTRWKWSLAEAHVVIDKLVSVFKSRKFSDLLGEIPDFPAFLRRFNLRLLKEIRRSDSAFSIMLKIIAMAAVENNQEEILRVSNKTRRLLSLIMPIGKVPFTKQNPPVKQELSMLYNRFSSVIIAIYLERSPSAVKSRVEQARRYVDFSNLDWKSKQACIRAAMHIAILTRHLGLPLDEPLKWLDDITTALLADYQSQTTHDISSRDKPLPVIANDQGQTVLCLQLLLGSVRLIIETPNMDPEIPATSIYPDVGLLSGPWIKSIFAIKTLTSIVTTGLEIQKLVLAFLDARAKVIQPPRLSAVANEESQESQDYFADYDDEFDYNDPDFQAILDSENAGKTEVNENRLKDAAVAEIMDNHIIHAIYRLIIQHFKDPSNLRINDDTTDGLYSDTDKWVDCWVGCAAVVVHNERRIWPYYLEMGSQSWISISDSSLRRRVGLRFMHRLLQLDPPAYRSHQDVFLKVLMESLVTFKLALEGEYAMLLFSIDGLRHKLLRNLPVDLRDENEGLPTRCIRFFELRSEIIAAIFNNLDEIIGQESEDRVHSHFDIQTCIGFVIHMLSTMRDVYESLESEDAQLTYLIFCRRIFNLFRTNPRLSSQSRFMGVLSWAKSIDLVKS